MTEAEQVEAAKSALDKATPGPWWIERDGQKGTPHIEDNYEDWIAQLAITPAMMGHIEANATLIAAAPALVRRVQELEDWQAKVLPWLEKVRDSLTPLKNGDYLDDSEGIQYELDQIKKLEALIAQGGK